MKAETLKRSNILILLCDNFTIARESGLKAENRISSTYVTANNLPPSIKVRNPCRSICVRRVWCPQLVQVVVIIVILKLFRVGGELM